MNKTETKKETATEEGTEKHRAARATLEIVAHTLRRPGFSHVGSISLHFYKNEFSPEVQIHVLPMLKNVPEGFAIEGAKEINRVMRAAYGHSEPRKRK